MESQHQYGIVQELFLLLYVWSQSFPLLMGLPGYLADNFSSNYENKK